MKIESVRKLTRMRIAKLELSQSKYADRVGAHKNSVQLFLSGKKPYVNKVPQAILNDLELQEITLTTYTKVPK